MREFVLISDSGEKKALSWIWITWCLRTKHTKELTIASRHSNGHVAASSLKSKRTSTSYLGKLSQFVNIAHCTAFRWYRAGVEHSFSQCKKFGVLGGKYRGRVSKDSERLTNLINVVMCTVALQVSARPLRFHRALLDDGAMDQARDAGAEMAHEERAAARDLHDGLPLANPAIDIRIVGASVAGPGPEPDPDSVDTGYRARDFAIGQRVLVWWWGLWYAECPGQL